MKRHKLSAIAILAAFGLAALVTPAVAADETSGAKGASSNSDTSKAEETTAPVPAWRSFGSGGDEEDLEETFFRLSQDFVSTSEIGVRRLGHVPIWPRGELKMGPVRILPYFRESVEWESNVYNRPSTGADDFDTDDGRKSGWALVTEPGVMADTYMMGGRFRLLAAANGRWYERSRKGQSDDYEIDSQVGARYSWPNGAWLSAGYAYERRSEPIEVEFTQNYQRTNNRFFWSLGFDRDIFFGSKAQLELGTSTRDVQPNEGRQFESTDRTETEAYARISYPFWRETTRVYVRGRYRRYNRETDALADGDLYGIDFGIDGSIPILDGDVRGLRGTISIGFDHSDYDTEDIRPNAPTGRSDSNDNDEGDTSLAFRAGLQYVISPRQTLDLRAQRSQQYSAYSNWQLNDRVDLTYTRTITPRLTARAAVFLEHTNPSGESPAYQTPGARPTGRSPNRHTSRGGVGLGGRYVINEWLDADLSWSYDRRNGESDRSYTNHQVILGLTLYMNALRPQSRRSRANNP